jgi:hypothetical protein
LDIGTLGEKRQVELKQKARVGTPGITPEHLVLMPG